MPSRKSHTKSRHGCLECKKRKVKCDEARPHCMRCIARESECHYTAPFLNNHESSSAVLHTLDTRSPPPTDRHFPHLDSLNPTLQGTLPNNLPTLSTSTVAVPAMGINLADGLRQDVFRTHDLALIHHYTTETYKTFSGMRSSAIREIWQRSVPKLAFGSPFLLHGILAAAAGHLTHTSSPTHNAQFKNEEENYHEIAKHHYTMAISLFRSELDHVNSENGTPIFAFSLLLICVTLGMPHPQPTLQSQQERSRAFITHIIESFRLIQGVKDIIATSTGYIQESIFRPLIHIERDAAIAAFTFDAEVAIRFIETKIRGDFSSQKLQEDYEIAVKMLRGCNPQRAEHVDQSSIVLAWPAMITPVIFTEMEEGKPIALAMLGFFGTLLHILREVWWIGDTGKRLVEAVADVLPRGWETVIVWAKMNVGLSQKYTTVI